MGGWHCTRWQSLKLSRTVLAHNHPLMPHHHHHQIKIDTADTANICWELISEIVSIDYHMAIVDNTDDNDELNYWEERWLGHTFCIILSCKVIYCRRISWCWGDKKCLIQWNSINQGNNEAWKCWQETFLFSAFNTLIKTSCWWF